MEFGCHVLSEKPMALNSEDCETLLAAIKRTGKRYMTAQVVRFMNAYKYLRGVIESGKYGKLESLAMRRYSQAPLWSWENWFMDEKKSGFVALDLMIHDMDYMQSVFGEPRDIVGVYHDMAGNYTNFAFANYIYDGFAVSIETGWYNEQTVRFGADFKAIFEHGSLILKDGELYDNNEKVDFSNTDKVGDTGINISNVDGYAGEIKYFIDCINSQQPAEMVTPESAAATITLVERTLKALTRV
jgi:predicted dehydrogenase